MEDKTIAVIAGIAALVILQLYALYLGIDGQIFSLVISSVTAIIGYLFGFGQGVKAAYGR